MLDSSCVHIGLSKVLESSSKISSITLRSQPRVDRLLLGSNPNRLARLLWMEVDDEEHHRCIQCEHVRLPRLPRNPTNPLEIRLITSTRSAVFKPIYLGNSQEYGHGHYWPVVRKVSRPRLVDNHQELAPPRKGVPRSEVCPLEII